MKLTHDSNCHWNYGHDCNCGLDSAPRFKPNPNRDTVAAPQASREAPAGREWKLRAEADCFGHVTIFNDLGLKLASGGPCLQAATIAYRINAFEVEGAGAPQAPAETIRAHVTVSPDASPELVQALGAAVTGAYIKAKEINAGGTPQDPDLGPSKEAREAIARLYPERAEYLGLASREAPVGREEVESPSAPVPGGLDLETIGSNLALLMDRTPPNVMRIAGLLMGEIRRLRGAAPQAPAGDQADAGKGP